MLTVNQVARAMPAKLKVNVSQELVDKINGIANDPLHAETIKENFISYTSILQNGRYKMEDYLNAVAYASYKMMGYNNNDSYFRTFPDRHAALVARGASSKDISSYVHSYNKNKLVNNILEQAIIPTWILNQDKLQMAINTQVEIMTDPDISPMARTAAANSVMTHLAKPKEAANFQLNIGTQESSGMNELVNALDNLARQQLDMVKSGIPTKSVAAANVIKAKPEDIDHETA
jgi:hypothetical protein